jgi:serine/threonine protein kinase
MVESRFPMYCSSCGAQVSSNGRFCSTCGSALDLNSAATIDSNDLTLNQETIAPPSTPRRTPSSHTPTRPPRTPISGTPSISSSDPIGRARFVPGQMIAERYRIVSIVGRGGMGEVYRAEDLTLSQIVAIKFLPDSLSQDASALARFHSEVRIARQVSHPNVCRVFDIGDADGSPFLSMEYVDGEDLASVVRRIGRLSPERATEIARQICAGLAAAHERGVIHRDLKPANVMLDGAGKIRITVFGLAGIAASIQGSDVRAGTPAYMAPEQLAGREVTAKSDIYSLGLILYEILTGKRAFDASTLPELMKLRESGTITNPSTLVRDLDPLVERVILRCLEADPAQRPASALKVAAALPGGDPLAAALAAGETPSPEMVAAAGATEGMRPHLALSLLATVIVGLIAFLWIAERILLVNRVPLENSPDVLANRAREMVKQLHVPGAAGDLWYGFDTDGAYLNYIQEYDKTPSRWTALSNDRPSALVFRYRQSPYALNPAQFFSSGLGGGGVTPDDPPSNRTGMISLVLDSQGRLLHLEAVPPEKDSSTGAAQAPHWPALFSAAGLDFASFKEAAPQWTPLAWGDARAAWMGTLPGRSDLPIRIEAASYRGEPIYFDLLFPWSEADRDAAGTHTRREEAGAIVLSTVFLLVLIGGLLVARWNLRQGRADQKGAVRLCVFVFLSSLIVWVLQAHHVGDVYELSIVLIAIAWALLVTFFVLILYVALEPFVRRREPHILISWTRLLAGGFRDPLVGRDLLIGVVYGILVFLFERSDNLLLPLFGKLPPQPGVVSTDTLSGVHVSIADLLFLVLFYTLYSLCIFFLLFLLQRLLRRTWLAVIAVAAIGAFLSFGNPGEYRVFAAAGLVALYVSFLLVLKRFGLLPLVVGLVVQNVLAVFPATIHLSRWYAPSGFTGLGAIALVAGYSFYIALAGQRLFSMESIDR